MRRSHYENGVDGRSKGQRPHVRHALMLSAAAIAAASVWLYGPQAQAAEPKIAELTKLRTQGLQRLDWAGVTRGIRRSHGR